jgi:hypothetical protein
MRFLLATGVALLLTSSGCGSMQESFQKGFDKNFKDTCRTEAVKKGVTQQIADKYCDCALAKFKETKSMDQAAKACVAEIKLGASH